MGKVSPKYSKTAINKAGDAIRNQQSSFEHDGKKLVASVVIENFRASHAYILNTFQANLRTRSRYLPITFAQRLKRKSTIFDKLKREPEMQLARMHDIAGCRLIFENIKALNSFQKNFRQARFNHVRRHKDKEVDPYDYITRPKTTGYRGRHDVYQYIAYAPAGRAWNGLNIEIQYRTQVQHSWATAVEIAGSITENRPKFNQGDERYLNFFRITSELLARHHEGMVGCLKDWSETMLKEEFEKIEGEIHLLRSLTNINKTSDEFKFRKNIILIFDEKTSNLKVESFDYAPSAMARYFTIENESNSDVDVVLVRADSSDSIRNAYKNYFSDSTDFVQLVEQALK